MEYNSIKNPMHSIDLLTHIFEFEIYESDCPKHYQVTLDHSTNTIWFGDVNIFLTKLKNYLTQFSYTKYAYENVILDKEVIVKVNLKYESKWLVSSKDSLSIYNKKATFFDDLKQELIRYIDDKNFIVDVKTIKIHDMK